MLNYFHNFSVRITLSSQKIITPTGQKSGETIGWGVNKPTV